jgi:hypothetical protein
MSFAVCAIDDSPHAKKKRKKVDSVLPQEAGNYSKDDGNFL